MADEAQNKPYSDMFPYDVGHILILRNGYINKEHTHRREPQHSQLYPVVYILARKPLKKCTVFLCLLKIFPSGTQILSMLFPIVSASLGHMMGEVSAVSQGSRSLRDDRPQVPFLLWFIRASQFSVMEIHLNQRPFAEPSGELHWPSASQKTPREALFCMANVNTSHLVIHWISRFIGQLKL